MKLLCIFALVLAVWAAVAFDLKLKALGSTLLSFALLLLVLAWLIA